MLDTLPVLILLLVWISIFREQTAINGYSLADILQYYLLAQIIQGISSVHFEKRRIEQIREGKIDFYLIRPLGYLWEIFLDNVGGKIFYWLTSTTMAIGIYLLFNHFLTIAPLLLTFQSIAQFLFLLASSYLIAFFLGALIVMLGFWFEYAEGAEHFKWVIVTIFSGWMIPLELMPTWLNKLATNLPFKYLYAIPIGVLQGRYELTITDLSYITLFITALYLTTKITWAYAKHQYTSHGG